MSASETSPDLSGRRADLYRMVMDEHVCPFGLRAKALLERQGYEVDDHKLKSRKEVEAFQDKHDVETTPQVFIKGERVGGYEDLRRWFGLAVRDKSETSYTPVIAVFGMAALIALAVSWAAYGDVLRLRTAEWFVSISMCILAVQKLRDLRSFADQFLGYDLLAQRSVRYASFYPFAEGLAGVLMTAGAFIWLASPLALFIGSIGAVSVFKAVYIDKRDLKCACVGGDSNVPLGAISLTENLMMVAMGAWMLIK